MQRHIALSVFTGCALLAATIGARAALFAPDLISPPIPFARSPQPDYALPPDDEAPPPPRRSDCSKPAAQNVLLQKYRGALQRYSRSKVRVMLEQHFQRSKDGMTLSVLFPDYRAYRLVVRTSPGIDVTVEDSTLQKNFYAFKEGDKIVMAPDIMWMADAEKERVIRQLVADAMPQWSFDAYRREGAKTLEVASKRPFQLDCSHARDLDGLINHSVAEMRGSDAGRVISPLRFGGLLTILRGYITFAYYKSLSHEEFDSLFREMVKAVGNQTWAHQKLSRLLGLHVIGRIESNFAFRRTYEAAIAAAAAKYPRVPRKWIEQIIWIESRGDPKSISRAGAYGLMQLMPLVYLGVGVDNQRHDPLSFASTINPFDALGNIERGAAFLDKLQQRMHPTIRRYDAETRRRMIFHAYNCGITRVLDLVRKHGRDYVQHVPDETKAYLDRLVDFPDAVSELQAE